MKRLILLAVTVALSLVPESFVHGMLPETERPAEWSAPVSRRVRYEAEPAVRGDIIDITLYFRYADTKYLGVERSTIDLTREETVATLMISELVSGPDAQSERLSGLFPMGTRVISVKTDGPTAFVTLSSEFLGRPDGAPLDWEESDAWQTEAALRRRLAFQSIVLSLTEGGQCQRVQLYTAEADDSVPQRIPLYLLNDEETDTTLRLAACGRDEALLITPSIVMDRVLKAWKEKDWASAYPFIHAGEPVSNLQSFEREMKDQPVSLLSYTVSNGTIAVDGQSATVVIDAEIQDAAGERAQIAREAVPVYRFQDNWMLEYESLLSLMIRD